MAIALHATWKNLKAQMDKKLEPLLGKSWATKNFKSGVGKNMQVIDDAAKTIYEPYGKLNDFMRELEKTKSITLAAECVGTARKLQQRGLKLEEAAAKAEQTLRAYHKQTAQAAKAAFKLHPELIAANQKFVNASLEYIEAFRKDSSGAASKYAGCARACKLIEADANKVLQQGKKVKA